jgi:hypothetical protein
MTYHLLRTTSVSIIRCQRRLFKMINYSLRARGREAHCVDWLVAGSMVNLEKGWVKVSISTRLHPSYGTDYLIRSCLAITAIV